VNGRQAADLFLDGRRVDFGEVEDGRILPDEEALTFLDDAVGRAVRAGRTDVAAELATAEAAVEERMFAGALEDPDVWISLDVETRADLALEALGLDPETGP
jgi:hypothetical protein